MMRFALVFGAWVLATTPLSAQMVIRSDSGSVIQTSGTGEIVLSPDRAEIRLIVESRASTAAAAASANTQALNRVLEALNGGKQPTDSILVVGISVHPNENMQSGDLTGYTASASIKVKIRSVERVGEVLDRALQNGATGVPYVTYDSDREDAARNDALARGFEIARAKAEALARAAGVRLGPLLRISAEGDSDDYRFPAAMFMEMSGGRVGASITPQDVVVRHSVSAVWSILR
jgi:uncharacterized protein YggE